ncbi:MAG: hypothetical protein AB7O28_23815, partial [Vicinamibacterales bacterium]
MSRPTLALAIAALAAAAPIDRPAAAQDAAPVAYTLGYRAAGEAHVHVEIAWSPPLAARAALVMPRAIPMGYGEQRYDRFVHDVTAHTAAGRTLAAEREEGPRWRLDAGTTKVTYRVDLRELERAVLAASDQSRVRDGYLGLLGYAVFAFVDGFETRPARLHVEGPAGWPVFATLAPRWPLRAGPVDAAAEDYYALADGQIAMGPR